MEKKKKQPLSEFTIDNMNRFHSRRESGFCCLIFQSWLWFRNNDKTKYKHRAKQSNNLPPSLCMWLSIHAFATTLPGHIFLDPCWQTTLASWHLWLKTASSHLLLLNLTHSLYKLISSHLVHGAKHWFKFSSEQNACYLRWKYMPEGLCLNLYFYLRAA